MHHRVKNNLQLIASILNLQMRQAVTPEARTLMKGVQDRVMSLATIHRGLYQTSGLTDIMASELLSDLARQVVGLGTGGGRSVTLESNLDPVRLTPDQAVPLALLTTEALTNALKYAGAPAGGGAAWLRLGLRHDAVAGTATLVTGEAEAVEADKAAGSGYRETEHVKTFYDTARF